jgi:hypothetical protein
VKVAAGATVTLEIVTERKVVKLGVIEVAATKKIDTKTSEQSHHLGRRKLEDLAVDDPVEAVALSAGFVSRAGQLHVRGGRQDELRVRINDVEVSNVQTLANANVALLAVEDVTAFTGGLDAERGGTLSSIIEITTREGADSLFGQLRWDTDRYGEPTRTFDDFDRFAVAAGGPTPIPRLTW